jgi:pimeloyl-ACP methyl ester carboxylesterase
MRLILLPGMDGTGDLFAPLLAALPDDLVVSIVRYPMDRRLDFSELHPYLDRAIPAREPYVILAESFSGPLALEHAARKPEDLKALILCATFARNPLPRPIQSLAR